MSCYDENSRISTKIEEVINQEYKLGLETDIVEELAPLELSVDIMHFISNKKKESELMLQWHLKTYENDVVGRFSIGAYRLSKYLLLLRSEKTSTP